MSQIRFHPGESQFLRKDVLSVSIFVMSCPQQNPSPNSTSKPRRHDHIHICQLWDTKIRFTYLDTIRPISSRHRHTCRGSLCRTDGGERVVTMGTLLKHESLRLKNMFYVGACNMTSTSHSGSDRSDHWEELYRRKVWLQNSISSVRSHPMIQSDTVCQGGQVSDHKTYTLI